MIKRTFTRQLIMKKLFLLMLDIAVIMIASFGGMLLRFDFEYWRIDGQYLESIWGYLPIGIVITIALFYFFKLYHSLWNYAGVTEMENIFAACGISTILQYIGMTILRYPVPRSYFFIYGAILFLLTMSGRFSYRLLRTLRNRNRKDPSPQNTMIIGGGEAANLIIKEISSSKHIHNAIVKCIIDDAPEKQGSYINGIRIMGTRQNIIEYVDLYNIQQIIIAMPSAPKKTISEIVSICKETNCELKILPGIYQMVTGEVVMSKIRKVEIEDLLGREPIQTDLDSIMGYVKGKVILVTGGGGSIGSELCRQLASHDPKQLIIIDNYENNAYSIQQELKKTHPELDLVVRIATVRDPLTMKQIFRRYRPNIVYHAAAHKHVPLMEDSPKEAIKNNVIGTFSTVVAADQCGVERFVMISTDKAVNPTNVMGASKRICEMIIQTYNNRSKTEFVAVRFGNVLGSNGSVIPLFKQQIDAGGPVTVTHPDIIRYFMTIPEAVSLVLQAGAYAKGGEIFVLDMGEPVKILDLAKNLIRLCGYEPNVDIKIEFSGLRPGEKLYEELLMAEEGMKETENKRIHIGKPIEMDEEKFYSQIEALKVACHTETADIRQMIKEIVPTYVDLQEKEQEQVRNVDISEEKKLKILIPSRELAKVGVN